MRKLLIASLFAAACGDNKSVDLTPDSSSPDPDSAPDTNTVEPFVAPTPFSFELSATGPDQVQSAVAAEDGKFFGAAFAADTPTGAKMIKLVKFGADGLDTTFGTDGVVTTNVEFKGGNGELGIVKDANGKILISATVAATLNAADRDVAVIRFNENGTLDNTFNGTGVAVISLNTAHDNGTALVGPDAARGIAVNENGIYVLANARGIGTAMAGGPRTDTDFTVARITTLGILDVTFGDAGIFQLDIKIGGVPQEKNSTPRGIKSLPDGKVIVGGYQTTPGIGGGAQPVIFRLDSDGDLDTSFAGGVFHEAVLQAQTEVYNFAIHGDKIVTGGYGRQDATPSINNYISLRFDLDDGARDLTWGGTANGAVVFDPSGAELGSNCRNAIALPGGKTLLTGSTGPSNDPAQDAVFAILDADGVLDTEYGTGVHKFALGANGNDQFWGGAISGDQIAVVGYKGGGMNQTDTVNDDAFAAVFTVR